MVGKGIEKKDHLFYFESGKMITLGRWMAISFTLFAVLISSSFSELTLSPIPLFILCSIWALGNFFLTLHTMALERFAYLRYGSRGIHRLLKEKSTIRSQVSSGGKLLLYYMNFLHATGDFMNQSGHLKHLGHLQILLDILCLLGIIHFSGGVESPFSPLLVLPYAGAAITLPFKDTLYHLAFGMTGLSALFLSEKYQFLTKTKFVNPVFGDFGGVTPLLVYQVATLSVLCGILLLVLNQLGNFYRKRLKTFQSSLRKVYQNSERYRYALEETDITVLLIDSEFKICDIPILASPNLFQGTFLGKTVEDLLPGVSLETTKSELPEVGTPLGLKSLKKVVRFEKEGSFFVFNLSFYFLYESEGQRYFDLIIRDHTELSSVQGELAKEHLKKEQIHLDLEDSKAAAQVLLEDKKGLENAIIELKKGRADWAKQAEIRTQEILKKLEAVWGEKVQTAFLEGEEALARQKSYLEGEKNNLKLDLKMEMEKLNQDFQQERLKLRSNEARIKEHFEGLLAQSEANHFGQLEATVKEYEERINREQEQWNQKFKEKEEEWENRYKVRERCLKTNLIDLEKNLHQEILEKSKLFKSSSQKRVEDAVARLESLESEKTQAIESRDQKIKILTGEMLGFQEKVSQLNHHLFQLEGEVSLKNQEGKLYLLFQDLLENWVHHQDDYFKDSEKFAQFILTCFPQDPHIPFECAILENGSLKNSPKSHPHLAEFTADPRVRAVLFGKKRALNWGAKNEWTLFPISTGSTLQVIGGVKTSLINAKNIFESGKKLALMFSNLYSNGYQIQNKAFDFAKASSEKGDFIKKWSALFSQLPQTLQAQPQSRFLAHLEDLFGVTRSTLVFACGNGKWRRVERDSSPKTTPLFKLPKLLGKDGSKWEKNGMISIFHFKKSTDLAPTFQTTFQGEALPDWKTDLLVQSLEGWFLTLEKMILKEKGKSLADVFECAV